MSSSKLLNLLAIARIVAIILLIGGAASLLIHKEMWLTQSPTGAVSVDTRVNILNATPTGCDTTFAAGLHLVSFFCITSNTPRDTLLQNLTNVKAIYQYVRSGSDSWRVYNASLPSYVVNDFETFSFKEGYFMVFNDTGVINYNGLITLPNDIDLETGWNLVGYLTNESQDIVNGTVSINDTLTVMRALVPTTTTFIQYIPGSGGALTTVDPYRGYWINVTGVDQWAFT